MDFFEVVVSETKNGVDVFPGFRNRKSKDILIKDGKFKAVWSERLGFWSEDLNELIRIVDGEVQTKVEELKQQGILVKAKLLEDAETRTMTSFQMFCKDRPDTPAMLNQTLVFADDPPRKEDYSSVRLPYNIQEGATEYYDRFMNCCFTPKERHKLEWAVGSILAGDSPKIEKFIVIYGEPGSGKGTFLDIVEQLFSGYWRPFDAKKLAANQRNFATAVFRDNPLVGIQYDGDLSKVQDNTTFNTIVSHETQGLEGKYREDLFVAVHTFLFLGTNSLVQITDSKSGLNRRMIDVHTTGVELDDFDVVVGRIRFEIGAIAYHCREVYREAGPHRYNSYKPAFMQQHTNQFFMFMAEHEDIFMTQDGITTEAAYALYKQWFEAGNYKFQLNRNAFEMELMTCYKEFSLRAYVEGHDVRRYHSGFKKGSLGNVPHFEKPPPSVVMEETESLLDKLLADMPAQYKHETMDQPAMSWDKVETTLADLDTTREHYVKIPQNHIVIDFDLRGDDGEKNPELNLEAASVLKPTYSEYSRSGRGVHLHYNYVGDASQLGRLLEPGIEIKTYPGDSSLRRRLSTCNKIPVADIHDGLPLKETKNVLDKDRMESEAAIRRLILRNLAKEIHPGTKPSIDFIWKILEDAYASGIPYDVTNMRQRILAFANNSTNQAEYCLKKVMDMKFSSETEFAPAPEPEDDRIVFYDVEVFPNLFVLCWKFPGEDASVVSMINPSPAEVEEIARMNLVGFNNRRYDNHILYARIMGYDNEQLFRLSQRLTGDGKDAYFGDAYNMSFADILDFSSVKKTLKLFQIDLGLTHRELGLPWDQPVPEELWPQVVKYCSNDVITEEQVFEDRKQDFVARQMLAALSGLAVNETTYKHTAKIIFGDVKKPQADFVYTDLAELFPGYQYDFGKSTYKGEIVGEGGYVYAEEGMYTNVAVLDVASMHPASIRELNLFGPYTENFTALMDARLAIKAGDYNAAKRMLGGKLEPYLGSNEDAAALAYALKIIINTVYGLTSASFDNQFRDIRNKDNIVAKRGALFMITLKNAVQAAGYQVIHIKTDSIKIPDADDAVMELIKKMGEDYGYTFEHEMTYAKFCLVNDAVYIGEAAWDHTQAFTTRWHATGAQFIHPYVFKTLFSKEKLVFLDYCETRSVKGGAYLYLDFGDGPQFVGGAGSFVPVKEGTGGGTLLRGKDGIFHSASGSKGWLWKEAAVVYDLGLEDDIDMSYYRKLVDGAVTAISKFGDYEWFTS